MKYSFALIEDNVEIRQVISEYFANSERMECVMAVDTVEKFLKFHRDFMEIKLVLLDVILYNQTSIYDIKHILQREPDMEVIMFTVVDDRKTILQALANGATGYVLKHISMEALEESLLQVLEERGALLSPAIAKKLIQYFVPKPDALPDAEYTLSDKEQVTLQLLREGRTYQEIGENLGISVNGVRYYVKSIYKKFRVRSKGELIRKSAVDK